MKLKPCPFCGEEPESAKVGASFIIWCDRCNLRFSRRRKALAIFDWNTRHYPPEVQRAVERMKAKKVIIDDDYVTKKYLCPQCKTGLYSTLDKYCPCCSQALDWEE